LPNYQEFKSIYGQQVQAKKTYLYQIRFKRLN